MQQLQIPPLAFGETYIGAIGDQQGNLHHIILLPQDNDDASWTDQMAWAESLGADLPTRVELGLIWGRARDQLQKEWYWTNEVHHADSSYAWSQGFGGGIQYHLRKSAELRAVAVRRVLI